MELCSQKSRDPFLATAERWVDDEILRQASENVNINNEGLDSQAATEPWEKERTAIGGTRGVTFRKAWIHKFIEKLIIPVIGGAFLIGPMWLMVLHNTQDVCLVSTTIFVAVFGLIMAGSLEKGVDVMAATLAYAAVLVVFVGLTV